MNRQIKFRVWDKTHKRWLERFSINEDGDVLTWDWHSDYGKCYDYESRQNDFVIQQFTGVLDKNGAEIYEGDIVESDYGYGFPREAVDLERIIFNKCECLISDNIEIIGNIFQNPELLK